MFVTRESLLVDTIEGAVRGYYQQRARMICKHHDENVKHEVASCMNDILVVLHVF
jgi:hypothetical protein